MAAAAEKPPAALLKALCGLSEEGERRLPGPPPLNFFV